MTNPFGSTSASLEELAARCAQAEKDLEAERTHRNSLMDALRKADSDRWDLEAAVAALGPERERLNDTIRQQQMTISRLSAELLKAYRRPFRPLKYMLASGFLRTLATIVRPISEGAARRYTRSAAKRSPDRFALLPPPVPVPIKHEDWVLEFDTPDGDSLQNYIQTASEIPRILIIVEFEAGSFKPWKDVFESLECLIGVDWRAVFKLHRSDMPGHVLRILASEPRIQTLDDDIGINETIIVHFGAGAVLRPHSIRLLVEALAKGSDAVLAYGDEDKIGADKSLSTPWFKPAFSPLLAKQGLLLGRVVAMRSVDATDAKTLAEALLDENGDSQQYLIDFALRAGASRVISIPHIIFHNKVAPLVPPPFTRPSLPNDLPIASIIILTRDRWDLLSQCLESIYVTDWPREKLEIIVVDNGSSDSECVAGLSAAAEAGKIVVQRDAGPFNFSRLNNNAVRNAKGELVILLNNDTKAISVDWLRELAAYALLPNAGAVGPKLLYGDSTVQHGGVVVGIQGLAAHAHLGLQKEEGGYQNLANVTREILAVTGACVAIRKSKYLEIGGMREDYQVAFGDIVLCLDLYAHGYTNYYVHKSLFYHYESRTRGFDDTDAKRQRARCEAIQAWRLHKSLLQEDPFYSPNLSLEETYQPSFAPRRRPWWTPDDDRPLHVLMLSTAHKRGYGVPVVMAEHARGLIERGYRVSIGGPVSDHDFEYPGCHRLDVADPRLAMRWAIKNDVDVIIAHTPPFYSIARWAGHAIPVVAYDHGEPPPERFRDASERREILKEKDFCLHMSARVYTISEAIKMESRTPVDAVIRLGNTHLGRWDDSKAEARRRLRAENAWNDCFVVLNVARFHAAEQRYKGIDLFLETLRTLRANAATASKPVVFVLCGKGDEADYSKLRRSGIDVRAGVSDAALEELYAAADAYANFSQWEGYNLGIGQALAMGLPVVASDIPAHRAFGVTTVNSPAAAAQALMGFISSPQTDRTPRLWTWDEPINVLAAEIESLCRHRSSLKRDCAP